MEDAKLLGKKLTVHYALIQAAYIMFYCSIFSFATVFLLSRGFSNTQVGLTMTFSSAAALVFQPFVAGFADKTKRFSLRSILVAMLAAVIFFSILLWIVPAVVLPVAVFFVLLVVFFSTQIALVTSLSMAHINSGVPVNFSLARGIGSFAFALLSILLGFLVDDLGGWIIMLVNIVVGLIGIGLVLTFPRPQKQPLEASEPSEQPAAAGMIDFILDNKRFMAVVGSVSLIFFSHTLINSYTIQIVNRVGGSSADMGIAIAIAGFLELPAMALFPLILKKMRSAGLIMKIAGVFFVIKAIATLLAPSMGWIYAAQTLQVFAYAMITPASVYYVNQVIHDVNKNKGQAWMGMTMGISGLFSNYAGGLMLDSQGGVTLMLIVGIAVSLAGLGLLFFIDKPRLSSRVEEVVS